MNLRLEITSWTFALPAISALALLVYHAVKTHGWIFLVIWLVLPAVIVNSIAFSLDAVSSDGAHAREAVPSTIDALFFLIATFYLSALLGKGFVERSRFAGSPFALAAISGCSAALFMWVLLSANRGQSIGVADTRCLPSSMPRLRFEMVAAFPAAFVASVCFFAFAYRWISIATPNNGWKLAALTALAPAIGAAACGIGLLG